MDIYKEKVSLFYKAKSIASSLFGIVLWSAILSAPRQISISSGLKTLVYSQRESSSQFIVHSYTISPPPSSSSLSTSASLSMSLSSSFCSSWSSMLDDLIGTDSGVHLDPSEEEAEIPRMEKMEKYSNKCHNLGKRNQELCEMKKKYPPPIPLLARTSNLDGHMPRILTRHYCDGRLILREEKVKHHEYFEAYRENGTLILKLVQLNDTVECCHSCNCEKKEEIEMQDLQLMEEDGSQEDQESNNLMETFSESCLPKSYYNNLENGSEMMISASYLSCNIASAHRNNQSATAAANLAFTRPMAAVV
ncbi:hypothetical protein JCGZ_12002 [Jatropha curcas]|uniref:FAF domain-containing protein n=1 Tax=Jatropha curcas TaxID=180498 RepID=A0A067KKE3_JATCU|nr:uncharacterized protein LOC105639022 [Jatropha curcas]KDP32710.1 hypothetical protein JCGZ_12002 [Jatropha curcas]